MGNIKVYGILLPPSENKVNINLEVLFKKQVKLFQIYKVL